jgi:hypothetical protein
VLVCTGAWWLLPAAGPIVGGVLTMGLGVAVEVAAQSRQPAPVEQTPTPLEETPPHAFA